MTAFTVFWPDHAADAFNQADVIIVFGAGMDPDGTLHRSATDRVEKGVTIYLAGNAPQIHFTGGRGAPGGPAAGEQMAALAQSLGVPKHAITHEDESQSTLQNALFSLPSIGNTHSAILVSEGFHLPRVAASTLWAGGPTRFQFAFSTRFRETRGANRSGPAKMILREAAAWWFNAARAIAFNVGGVIGVADNKRNGWLH